jgi:calcium binding protein
MPQPTEDPEREARILMEIVVDAYGPEERAMGWYYYLDGKLEFPFTARCILERRSSPLQVGDEVEVIGMPPEDECEREMLVEISWRPRALAVPLAQLKLVGAEDGSEATSEAIADWRYWVDQGHRF